MAEVGFHTFGPTCAYHEDEPDTLLPVGSAPPPVKIQFFYASSLPIDDPLSPLPSVQPDRSTKQPPQPFSAHDNAALEEAWQGFQKTQHSGKQTKTRPNLKGMFSFPKFKDAMKSPSILSPSAERSAGLVSKDQQKGFSAVISEEYNKLPKRPETHADTHGEKHSKAQEATGAAIDSAKSPRQVTASISNPKAHGRETSIGSDRGPTIEADVMLSQSPPESHAASTPIDPEELRREEAKYEQSSVPKRKNHRHISPFRQWSKGRTEYESISRDFAHSASTNTEQLSSQPSSSDMSGRPFARAPSKRNVNAVTTDGASDPSVFADASEGEHDYSRSTSRDRAKMSKRKASSDTGKVYVPVGVARLHLVEMPNLVMKPIYWSPINDTSEVIRATWFYKDTMLPVPVDVANRLEVGYEYIKPYYESYQDELQACIDNGASAELKVVHRLWPEEKKASRPNTGDAKLEERMNDDELSLPIMPENIAIDTSQRNSKRLFQTHSVIYTDRKNAQILKPSLLPSVSQNRRPLSSIRKGRQIGVAVVRGFDRKAWSRMHLATKMTARAAHARIGAYMSQSGDATTRSRRASCTTCHNESQTPQVSDLVLVIHGIGQKLSERVDSYHFTHAINGLRRDFNVELSSENVKGNLKKDSGIMVLPINWRLTVSFDEAPKSMDNRNEGKKYGLGDITPDTLPAVRSIISDVMLDIPYYMSHHKDKMTSAVIREANRVYRLWCRNNPGFQENGRVHLVAHSLGSVMAMEILSKQPTRVPKDVNLQKSDPSEKMFEFDTTNLFCCGSPSGFFLLLNNARLIPRKGRNKPDMEGEDHGVGIAAEDGYGCLAVDNLYNICHRNDPIAYLLNAAVDPDHAATLQPATIPSASSGFLAKLWSSAAGMDAYAVRGLASRPTMQSMPSTVEMETHNFTQEEIAEKRMYLLNENGQVDYYLSSGGGPLEIQYLSMLSAHSSYWLSQDFVRFLVIEIGRKSGRKNTIEVLKAVKKREWRRGSLT